MLPAGVGQMIKVHIAWDVTPVGGAPAAAPAGPSTGTSAALQRMVVNDSQPAGMPQLQPTDRTASAPTASSLDNNDGSPFYPPVLALKSVGCGASSSSSSSGPGRIDDGSVELRVSVGVEWISKPTRKAAWPGAKGQVTVKTLDQTSNSQQGVVAAAVRWLQYPDERHTLLDVMPRADGTQDAGG